MNIIKNFYIQFINVLFITQNKIELRKEKKNLYQNILIKFIHYMKFY